MPRPKHLDHDDRGAAAVSGRPWWEMRRPRSKDLRFEDGPTERVIDQRMPLPEPTYTSTAGLCIESAIMNLTEQRDSSIHVPTGRRIVGGKRDYVLHPL